MSKYKLMEPFDIDNGELDGIRPQVVFCMGYEWRQVQDELDGNHAFNRPIHTPNTERLKRMLIRRGRQFRCHRENEEWTTLCVADVAGVYLGD